MPDLRAFAHSKRTAEFYAVLRKIGLPDRVLTVSATADEILRELFLCAELDR